MLRTEPPRDTIAELEIQNENAPTKRKASLLSRRHLFVMLAMSCAVAIIAAVAWRYQDSKSLPQFQIARVEKGPIESTVSATGTCNAVISVLVGSQVSGNIKALYADFNSVVKAGQLVALIDPQMFQAKVEQAEAAWRSSQSSLDNAQANAAKAEADLSAAKAAEANQLAAIAKAKAAMADAKAKLARRVDMFEGQILSKEDLDTAQAAYDEAVADLAAAEAQYDAAVHTVKSAQALLKAAQTQIEMYRAQIALNLATLRQARIDLTNTQITSPVDGVVVARQMDVGQTVAASFQAPTIFQIAQDLTNMQIDTNVDEADVGRLKVGQQATFRVDAYPGVVFEGPVLQIRKAPISVQNVITYDAVIGAHNSELKLFPGMTANVTVLVDRRNNVTKIPNAALRFKPAESSMARSSRMASAAGYGWHTVYVPGKDGKAHSVQVKVGISDGAYTEIEYGDVREGDSVIVGMKSKAPAAANAPSSMLRRL
jgi:HlyD family secretion protein